MSSGKKNKLSPLHKVHSWSYRQKATGDWFQASLLVLYSIMVILKVERNSLSFSQLLP